MKILLLLGIMAYVVQGNIEIKVIQKVCMSGDCDLEPEAVDNEETTTISSLKEANAALAKVGEEINQLKDSIAQAEKSANAVQSAGSTTSALVNSTRGSRRHRRETSSNVTLTSCDDPTATIQGSALNVTLQVIQGILDELANIVTTLNADKLNCYIALAQDLAQKFNEGIIPKLGNDIAQLQQLATQVSSAVNTSTASLAQKTSELKASLESKVAEQASLQQQIQSLGGSVVGTGCMDGQGYHENGSIWNDTMNPCQVYRCGNGKISTILPFTCDPPPLYCDYEVVQNPGSCCTSFKCKETTTSSSATTPGEGCTDESGEYHENDSMWPTSDPCYYGYCTYGQIMTCGLPCVRYPCDINYMAYMDYMDPLPCCPTCTTLTSDTTTFPTQTTSVMNGCVDAYGYHEFGSTWKNPMNACYEYFCDNGIIITIVYDCFQTPPCAAEPVFTPGMCCPVYNCSSVTQSTSNTAASTMINNTTPPSQKNITSTLVFNVTGAGTRQTTQTSGSSMTIP